MLNLKSEAKVKYLDGDFQIITHGDFVRCAVSGEPIPLSNLHYWSAERQEPYASVEYALQRYKETEFVHDR